MPLQRRTPLSQGTKGLGRGKPLSAGSKPLQRGAGPKRTPMKRTASSKPPPPARSTGPAADVRAVVIARDGGICQRCGSPGSNVQHREGRGMGGRGRQDAARTNGPEWLVVLCGEGNTSGCHAAVDANRRRSIREGFVILRNGQVVDATRVPVKTYRGWRLLTADGRSIRLSDPAQDVTGYGGGE